MNKIEDCKGNKTEVLSIKPVPVPLRPTQISYGLSWEQTQAFEVRSYDYLRHSMGHKN